MEKKTQMEFKDKDLVQRFHFHFQAEAVLLIPHCLTVSVSRLSFCIPVYMYTVHRGVCSVLFSVAVGLFSAPEPHTFYK